MNRLSDILQIGGEEAILKYVVQNQVLLKRIRDRLPPNLSCHCVACNVTDSTLVLYGDSPNAVFQFRFLLDKIREATEEAGYLNISRVDIRTRTPDTSSPPSSGTSTIPSSDVIRLVSYAAKQFETMDLGKSLYQLARTLDSRRLSDF